VRKKHDGNLSPFNRMHALVSMQQRQISNFNVMQALVSTQQRHI
jgi:hypothetical protein